MHRFLLSTIAACLGASGALAAPADAPSRKALEHCVWEHRNDVALGLASWVQRCDYGDRKIDFLVVGQALAVRYSDGGTPDPLVEVFDLRDEETPEAGLRRWFGSIADTQSVSRCVLAPYRSPGMKIPAAVKRYMFTPDAAYAKELEKTRIAGEINDPACGLYGQVDDGVQYFETQPASGARRLLFVRVGQDEPLFDEATLRLLPSSTP